MKTAVLITLVLVTACASTRAGLNVGHSAPEVEDDCDFAGRIIVRGTPAEHAFGDFYFFRTYIDCRSGLGSGHQLYVEDTYSGDWKFYDRAAMEGGVNLQFVQIDRSVGDCRGGCSLQEHFAALIPPDLMRRHAESGFQVRFYARRGAEKDIAVPATLVREHVVMVDSVLAAKGLGERP